MLFEVVSVGRMSLEREIGNEVHGFSSALNAVSNWSNGTNRSPHGWEGDCTVGIVQRWESFA